MKKTALWSLLAFGMVIVWSQQSAAYGPPLCRKKRNEYPLNDSGIAIKGCKCPPRTTKKTFRYRKKNGSCRHTGYRTSSSYRSFQSRCRSQRGYLGHAYPKSYGSICAIVVSCNVNVKGRTYLRSMGSKSTNRTNVTYFKDGKYVNRANGTPSWNAKPIASLAACKRYAVAKYTRQKQSDERARRPKKLRRWIYRTGRENRSTKTGFCDYRLYFEEKKNPIRVIICP